MPLFRDGRSRRRVRPLGRFGNGLYSYAPPGSFISVACLLVVGGSLLISADNVYAEKKAKAAGKKKQQNPEASVSPAEQSLTNIPLPIGHEAKGLVLPDFDSEGHMRGKFEAGRAHRIDEEHVGFYSLKITTFTPETQPDLRIEMSEATLNLKTRVLISKTRTMIHRADFDIAGDSVEFDTNSRTGKLIGNVKMVITDQSNLKPRPNE